MVHVALHWCLHLQKQMPLSVFIEWKVKTFSGLFPGLIVLSLESQLCWVGASYKAVTGSVVEPVVGLVTRA